ncbi:hypothetical protein D3C71_1092510 [compost metagenome]
MVPSRLRNADFYPVISIGTGDVAVELYRHLVFPALLVSQERDVQAQAVNIA